MKEWLISVSEPIVVIIDALALVVIAFGTAMAFWESARYALAQVTGHEGRTIWLRYARWLVAGLTFQLAADIIESSIIMNWEALGRLGAIAAIRTFLDYFLGRDVTEIRERDKEATRQPAA